FHSTESGSTFSCQLDSNPAAACDSGTVTYNTLSQGSHTFSVAATDAAGNTDPSPATRTWTVDTTRPHVTINQASGQADPTNSPTIHFTVVFTESVSDFAAADVTVGGTAGGTKTVTVTGSGTTYDVAVALSGAVTDGTVTASLAANVAHDAATNGNT